MSKALAAFSVSTESFTGTFQANDDKVNVRSLPDETMGKVVAVLKKDQVVEATDMTMGSFTIGTLNAPWYKIKSPAGWVFGSYLIQSETSSGQ